MSKLRGAVIGAGYFSQFHFDSWKRLVDVELLAVCDLDAASAQKAAAEYEIDGVYTDPSEMLDELELDFVDIVTRPDTHEAIVQEVITRHSQSSPLAVICQKPLAPTVPEAIRIVEATERAGMRFMVHENFRFQPWYREIKSMLDRGIVGECLHTITFRNRAGDGHGADAYLARQPYFQTMERFLIFEAGIHTIDTFRFLAGEIEDVCCVHRKLNPVIAGEDTALAFFRFDGGGIGVYDANRYNESTADNPRYTFGQVLVEADGGTIRLYEDGRMSVQRLGQSEEPHYYQHSHHGFAGDCVHETQKHFMERLLSGEAFETSGREYLKSIAVQEAMYRSNASRRWEKPGL